MEFIYVGDVVNTHGLKGELRILSDFEKKDLIFKKGNKIYLGKKKMPFLIHSYRKHKNYDMVTLEGIEDIEEAILWKGEIAYVKREEIPFDGLFLEELFDFEVWLLDKKVGIVTKIMKSKAHPILVIEGKKEILIPYVDAFIKTIDSEKKRIYIEEVEGLIDEN